jgi:UrcA family protein
VERTTEFQRGARQLLVSGLAAVVLGLGSAASFATTSNGVRTLTVSYGELDLSKPAGAEILYKRIKRAANTVCSVYESPMPWNFVARNRCIQTAVDEAVAKVNAPLLTALHDNKTTRVASK